MGNFFNHLGFEFIISLYYRGGNVVQSLLLPSILDGPCFLLWFDFLLRSDVIDENGAQFVAYFLPNSKNLETRREDSWNVKNESSSGYSKIHLLVFHDGLCIFDELEIRFGGRNAKLEFGGFYHYCFIWLNMIFFEMVRMRLNRKRQDFVSKNNTMHFVVKVIL